MPVRGNYGRRLDPQGVLLLYIIKSGPRSGGQTSGQVSFERRRISIEPGLKRDVQGTLNFTLAIHINISL